MCCVPHTQQTNTLTHVHTHACMHTNTAHTKKQQITHHSWSSWYWFLEKQQQQQQQWLSIKQFRMAKQKWKVPIEGMTVLTMAIISLSTNHYCLDTHMHARTHACTHAHTHTRTMTGLGGIVGLCPVALRDSSAMAMYTKEYWSLAWTMAGRCWRIFSTILYTEKSSGTFCKYVCTYVSIVQWSLPNSPSR